MCATAMFFAVAVLSSLVMCGAWLVVAGGSKFGWIDASWSFLVGLAGVVVSLFPIEGWEAEFWRRTVVATVALAWSLRLGLHIVSRTLQKDDPRYVALKAEWGANLARSPVLVSTNSGRGGAAAGGDHIYGRAKPAAGIALERPRRADPCWSSLWSVERIADAQLSRFARNTNDRDAVCDAGLWVSRDIQTIFSNGWAGWDMRSSR